MKCEDVRAAYLIGDLDAPERYHLDHCAACMAATSSLDTGASVLQRQALWEEPSPELEEHVMALLSTRPSGRTNRRRIPMWLASAAAAVAMVVGVAALVAARTPDWTVTMAGTAAAPVASGTISGWNTDEGTRIALQVSGLERAPSGYVYELWFSSDGAEVSAGTFLSAADVRLVVGVVRKDFPHLTVTLEPLDGDPTPSATTLLESDI